MTPEPTLAPTANNPQQNSSGSNSGTICDRGHFDEIELEPSEGFQRRLILQWGFRSIKVIVMSGECRLISHARAAPNEVRLVILECGPWLWVGAAAFCLSPRDVEVLTEKLAPRGIKVERL